MSDAIRTVSATLDLSKAIERAAASNDLLPPRHEDTVSGELAKRFVEYLRKQIDDGHYQPQAADFVQVPKGGFTSRPAALLTFSDRVLYEALVAPLRRHLRKYLMPDDVVLWPREEPVPKRWPEFLHAPLQDGAKYIVSADIAAFYDSIDHAQLEDVMVAVTGERGTATALTFFLGCVMRSRRGIPQGLLPSDVLATSFLRPFDAEMLTSGFSYWRHGDDIRIAAPSISEGRRAILRVETALRSRGLLINGAKCAIIKRETYQAKLAESSAIVEDAKKALHERLLKEIASDETHLKCTLNDPRFDSQLGWDLFYHGKISVADVIVQIRDHLEPSGVAVAEHMFTETMSRQPGTRDELGREDFHQRLVRSLLQLAAGRSNCALPFAAELLAKYPDKTNVVANYLLALVHSCGAEVVMQTESVLCSDEFMTPWQYAWQCRVLLRGACSVQEGTVGRLKAVAADEEMHWMMRVEAMKVIAARSNLPERLLRLAWDGAPTAYRTDLLEAAALQATNADWARRFLKGAIMDPVEAVVARHLLVP